MVDVAVMPHERRATICLPLGGAAARRIRAGSRTASTTAPASRTPLVGVVSDATHVQVEVPVVAAGLVLVLLALRARAADTGSMHPVSA